MNCKFRDWPAINNRLVKQGVILLDVGCLVDWKNELGSMNAGKEGSRFKYPSCVISFAGVLHCVMRLGFRQVEGLLDYLLKPVKQPVPDYSTVNRRFNKLPVRLQSKRKSTESLWVAIDSSGISVTNRGEWLRKVHRNGQISECKGFIKIHVSVDVRSGELVGFEVTTDKVGDNRMFKPLLLDSIQNTQGELDRVFADGSYDDWRNFQMLHEMNVEAGIKIDKNADISKPPDSFRNRRRGEPVRRQHARIQLADYDKWKEKLQYGLRWLAETFFSTFKRRFGEYVMARKYSNMQHELYWKAQLYNQLL